LHLILNMLGLWWFGSLLEQRIGSGRFLLLYLVSGLAGSAGALVVSPTNPTVGASGAIFGILGAGLVLEHQRDYVFGGSAPAGVDAAVPHALGARQGKADRLRRLARGAEDHDERALHRTAVAVEPQARLAAWERPPVRGHVARRPDQAVVRRRAHETQMGDVRAVRLPLDQVEARIGSRDDEEVASRAE